MVRAIIRGCTSAVSSRTLNQRGFSLIELLAVTAIIAIISGMLLMSNSRFGGSVLLENLAYDIALSIRQAQVYGVSVQRFDINSSSYTFAAGYGVHLDTNSPFQYITFSDVCTPANGLYDTAGGGCPLGETVGSVTNLERGFRIAKLCAPAGSTVASCTAVSNPGVNPVDILFKRPEPDAWISTANQSCILGNGICQQSLRIIVMSPRGDVTSVVVANNGQISVQR